MPILVTSLADKFVDESSLVNVGVTILHKTLKILYSNRIFYIGTFCSQCKFTQIILVSRLVVAEFLLEVLEGCYGVGDILLHAWRHCGVVGYLFVDSMEALVGEHFGCCRVTAAGVGFGGLINKLWVAEEMERNVAAGGVEKPMGMVGASGVGEVFGGEDGVEPILA